MLAGSVDSTLRASTTTRVPFKLHLDPKPLNAPADRVFKQTLRKKSHDNYYRHIFGGFAGSAFLAFFGGMASIYFGYVILGTTLLCFSGAFSAANYWICNAIPDVKIYPPSPSVKTTSSLDKSPMCHEAASKVLFRGVSYSIDYQAANGSSLVDKQVPDKITAKM